MTMIDGEVYETTINRFKFRFESDEGYVVVHWLEPKTDTWEHLTTLGRSLEYAIKSATEEASHWDFDEE
jgi:hypothetical protein